MEKNPGVVTITLDEPITRGSQVIESVELRKPKAGALRGLALSDVLQMDTASIIKLVPRISEPALTEQDMNKLDVADLVQFGTAAAGFLVPKGMRGDESQPA